MKRYGRVLAFLGTVLLFAAPLAPAQDGTEPPLPAALQQAAADYNANYQANEDRFRQRYEAGLATVRANPHLSAADRQRYARMMYEQYRQRSAANVALYREPLVQAIGAEAARRGGGQGHLQQTLGSSVLTADGEVSATHRGARGDTDMGGTAGRANEAARIASRLGFTPDAGNPNYLDIKSLELTINYETAGQSASGRGWTDTPGSSAHEAMVRSAARADETYISIAMSDTQPAKKAVLIQDHLKKANHGRALDADALLSDRHQAGLQVYSKGALKAAETAGLGEVELQAVLARSGLDLGPQDYQRMLDNLKLGYPPDAVGLTPENAAQFKQATDALLDAADARSTELAREQLAAQQERLERLEASLGDPELTPGDRDNLRRQIERGRLERADSLVRLREAREANAALRDGAPVEHLPGTPRPLPEIDPDAKVTSLTDSPRPSGTGSAAIGRVGSGAARVADVLDMVTLAKTAADLAAKGDGAGLAGLLGEVAVAVGSERLGLAALTKISPQLAAAYETFETSYGATRTFMELSIPGTDGRTLDAVTQDVMLASMDLATGAANEDRARREAAAAVLHVTALRKDGFTVAGGLTGPEVIERINANIAAGRSSLDGIEFVYPAPEKSAPPAETTMAENQPQARPAEPEQPSEEASNAASPPLAPPPVSENFPPPVPAEQVQPAASVAEAPTPSAIPTPAAVTPRVIVPAAERAAVAANPPWPHPPAREVFVGPDHRLERVADHWAPARDRIYQEAVFSPDGTRLYLAGTVHETSLSSDGRYFRINRPVAVFFEAYTFPGLQKTGEFSAPYWPADEGVRGQAYDAWESRSPLAVSFGAPGMVGVLVKTVIIKGRPAARDPAYLVDREGAAVQLFDAVTLQPVGRLGVESVPDRVSCRSSRLQFTPDGELFAALELSHDSTDQPLLRRWTLADGKETRYQAFDVPKDLSGWREFRVTGLGLDPGSRQVVAMTSWGLSRFMPEAAGRIRKVLYWDRARFAAVRGMNTAWEDVRLIHSPDGRHLLVVGKGTQTVLRQRAGEGRLEPGAVPSLARSQGGARMQFGDFVLLAGGRIAAANVYPWAVQRSLNLLDLDEGRVIDTVETPFAERPVASVAAPDGVHLIMLGEDADYIIDAGRTRPVSGLTLFRLVKPVAAAPSTVR